MCNSGRLIFVLVAIVVLSHLGSAQWTRNPEEFTGVSVFSLASDGSSLYAGTAGSVYRSIDNGLTWGMLAGSPAKVCTFAFAGPYIFAGSQDAAVGAMRSSDNGTTWVPINNGCQNEVSSLASCDTVLIRGFSGFTGPTHLFRSTDYGNSWTVGAGIQAPVYALGRRGNEVYAATRWTGVPFSLDSGLTWTNPDVFCGLPSNPVALETVQALAAVETTLFAAVSSEGVFHSEDGRSWEGANSGLEDGTVTAFAVSDQRIFAGTGGGGIFLSENRGDTWMPVNQELGNLNIQSLAVQGNFLLAGTPSGLWMRPLSELHQAQNVYDVFPLSAGRAIQYSYVKQCHRINADLTSSTVNDSGVVQYVVVDLQNDSSGRRIWNVSQKEHLFHREETWDRYALLDEKEWWVDDSSTFSVKENLAGLHELEADGKIWCFPRGGRGGTNRFYRYSYDSLFFVGVPGSEDRWSFDARRGMFARDYHTTRIIMNQGDTTLTIRIVGVPTVTSINNQDMAVEGLELLQNYPNPFNATTTIQYAVPHRTYVTLKVFNVLGQEVVAVVEGEIDAGYHTVRFDGSGLASGLYFYRIKTGDFVQTRKLVMMR